MATINVNLSISADNPEEVIRLMDNLLGLTSRRESVTTSDFSDALLREFEAPTRETPDDRRGA